MGVLDSILNGTFNALNGSSSINNNVVTNINYSGMKINPSNKIANKDYALTSKAIDEQIMNKLSSEIKIEVEKIKYNVTKEMSTKVVQINSELYGYFKTIVSNVIEKTFVEAYGDSFDLASLQSSIIYPSVNNFRPDFTYNKNKLKFYPKLNDRNGAFNKNQRKQYLQRNNPKDPDFFTGNFWDVYNSNEFNDKDDGYDSEIDFVSDLINDYQDFKPANQRLNILNTMSLDEVYIKAKTRALIEFNKQYKTYIKPQIKKKYGLDLG